MEEQNSPITFFEWLKRRRRALDLTQAELAQRVGCSVGALRKIEGGERRPSKQLAHLLAQALEVPEAERQKFVHVARGELNLERLRLTDKQPPKAFSTDWTQLPGQQKAFKKTRASPTPPARRIPLPATPLVGRDTELAALERMFAAPQCRLLTLTGMGGIGKTRLAIEFAIRSLSMFPGGVFYAPLTAVRSPEKVIPALADVLDFRFSGPINPKEQLLNYLSSAIQEEALLILDNLEQLLPSNSSSSEDSSAGLIGLVGEMLRRLEQIKILGTSRERLNILGEWTYELHGLSVPPADYVGQLANYNAIELFERSAQRTRADFQLSAEEIPYLIQICQMVEGVPLAMELAAAWVGLLSCREIAQEIQTNMDFLTTSLRDIPERHRSIRATFDYSWSLLSDEERWALCQLAVFQGGFERNAAGQIAGADLPVLASLSAKSLLRRGENGRYELHEVIRQYAQARLKEDARHEETYERHCGYYLGFLREREKRLKTRAQQEALRELMDEIDNIRLAWSWGIEHRKYGQLGQAGRAFGWYFEITGLYMEGFEQLELLVQALKAKSEEHTRDRALGLALIHQALLCFRKGDFDNAQRLYEEGIQTLRTVEDPILLADGLLFLGIIQHLNGNYELSYALTDEGLQAARAGDDPWLMALGSLGLGYLDSLQGRYAEGYRQMLVGLDAWRKLGDPHAIAMSLNFMAPSMVQLGLFAEARRFLQESIALCQESRNRWGLGTAYRFLGLTTLREGYFDEAQGHLRKSLEVFGENFVGWDIARTLAYLAEAVLKSGELDEARKEYRNALRSSLEAKALPIAMDALLGLSDLQAQSGNPEKALVLCYYILSHPCSEGDTKDHADRLRQALEASLSREQMSAARIAAEETGFEAIVQEALETR